MSSEKSKEISITYKFKVSQKSVGYAIDLVSIIGNTQFQFDPNTPIYFKYSGPSISIYLS